MLSWDAQLHPQELSSWVGRGYVCVPGCKSAPYQPYHASGIVLFTFPFSDPILMKKWETVFMNIFDPRKKLHFYLFIRTILQEHRASKLLKIKNILRTTSA